MRCEEFEQRLQWLLDQRQAAEYDRLLLTHARSCPPCAEVLAAQELLFDTLREGLPVSALDEECTRCVVERAARQELPRHGSSLRRLALAAALLLAAMLLLPGLAGRQQGIFRQLIARRAGWETGADPVRSTQGQLENGRLENGQLEKENAGQSRSDMRPGRRPRRAVAVAVATSAPEAGRRGSAAKPIGPKPLSSSPSSPPQAGEVDHGAAEDVPISPLDFTLLPPLFAEFHGESLVHVDQLTVGLRPIASSFSVALDALRRSFPIGRDQHDHNRRANITLPGTFNA